MATVNLFVMASVIINGEEQKIGSLYQPVSVTAADEILNNYELTLTGAATTQIFAASGAADVIICQASVAGTYLWAGTTDADNSSMVVPANFPLVISGTTNDYSATTAGRASAAESAVTSIKFEHAAGGKMKVWAIR